MTGAPIRVSRVVAASSSRVWEELRHIDRHVLWMADAESIEFTSSQHDGVGTSFRCRTKVGPIVLTDVMEITSWIDGSTMGVTHKGIVTGEGVFTLHDVGPDTCEIEWRETLMFPWWALGTLGAYVARPVLALIWRKNLRQLEELLTREHGA